MLSKIFNMHNVHRLHWVMMAGMACSAVVLSAGAAAAATPAFQAAAAGGSALKVSIPNILASLPDAGISMLQGLGDLPQVWEGLGNAAEAGELWSFDYQWGVMDHGAGHAVDAGAHGVVDASSHVVHQPDVAGSFEHAGEHAGGAEHVSDTCSVEKMIEWEASEPGLALVDQEVASGTYGSRAEYFSQFCHDHS